MTQRLVSPCVLLCLLIAAFPAALARGDSPMSSSVNDSPPHIRVIAHRGASGYLPEHTAEAKALAFGQGADFLEQDLVLTKDHVPIVLHDIHLDTVTNVAAVYPSRARADGRFYALDFTWEEVQTLRVHERVRPGGATAVFPDRFPVGVGRFRLSSFEEEIDLIEGLQRSSGRRAGLYPEIKQPAFHRTAGADISRIVIQILTDRGYTDRDERVIVQCFDAAELRRIRQDLNCNLTLIQLVEKTRWIEADAPRALQQQALESIADYADGVGPPLDSLWSRTAQTRPEVAAWLEDARRLGLKIHPWTLRREEVPRGFDSFESLHQFLLQTDIDAVFSDFPDESRRYFQAK